MINIKSKIGAHVSVAGGIDNAPLRAAQEGCETFQCFTRPPQGGNAPKLTPELLKRFKSELDTNQIDRFYVHAPYYINLASLNPKTRGFSVKVLREELERSTLLGAKYVMAHIGSHTGQSLEEGIAKAVTGIKEILKDYAGSTEFLVEISAGSGSVLGDTFQEVGEIVAKVKSCTGFGGICFDTCHAFASGYDFRTEQSAQKVLREFDKNIGLEWLKLTHVNDSKSDLGQKKDRHEHIGDGYIGKEGMANILLTKPFSQIDWILETAPEKRLEDVKNLRKIRDSRV